MKSGLTVKKDALSSIMKSLHALTGQDVLVGVPSDRAERKDPGQPVNNAEIGYWQEFGAPGANIPARPHLIPGVEKVKPDITVQLRAAATAALTGKPDDVLKAMHKAGLTAQLSVQRLIESGLQPDLSPLTLYKRKHRKKAPRQGEKPLIDTGGYLKSITYVIREK